MISREYKKFSQGILPLFNAINIYWSTITEKDILKADFTVLNEEKNKISNLISYSRQYPEWIFAYHFNPFFKESYQFFLLKLEILIDLTFSSHYFFEKMLDSLQLKELSIYFLPLLKTNIELIDYLIYFFNHNKVKEENILCHDEDDWGILEAKLFEELPAQLISSNLLFEEECLINYYQNIKDMRKILLELMTVLPE